MQEPGRERTGGRTVARGTATRHHQILLDSQNCAQTAFFEGIFAVFWKYFRTATLTIVTAGGCVMRRLAFELCSSSR